MAKAKEPVITVSTVFSGKQTDRQAFIDLIMQKKEIAKTQLSIDTGRTVGYNRITPKRGIHSGMEVTNED